MKKKACIAAVCAALYCALLNLLVLAESAYTPAPGEETISTFPKALWYSLTTLTTVGYGDLYPRTVPGRIIGAVFMLLSVGVLVFIISAVLSALKKHLLPKLKLTTSRDREWYIFTEDTPESAALARNLMKEQKKCLCVFAGRDRADETSSGSNVLKVHFPVDQILRLHGGRGKATVFCMGDSIYDNYRDALKLKDAPVCCMTEYEPDRIEGQLTVFHPRQCCARLYWQKYPIRKEDEIIALIGGGAYAAALLEQALMQNVYSPSQHLTYLVYGDPADFSVDHPYLDQILSVGAVDAARDSLLFLPAQWSADRERLAGADRVIVCCDSEEDAVRTLCRMRRLFPVSGTLHARLSEPFEGVETFGGRDEIFTPELVMKQELDRAAVALNEVYRSSVAGAPSWGELSGFLRRSNLASADHLDIKLRILLGDSADHLTLKERYARAYQAYRERKARDAEFFREVEHIRWMRFHILNNWHYAPRRDNAQRLHPLLLPYRQIPAEEHIKDDYAWEILGKLAERNE